MPNGNGFVDVMILYERINGNKQQKKKQKGVKRRRGEGID